MKPIEIIALIIIVLCTVCIWMSYHYLMVSHFTIKDPKLHHPLRIVMISDLHNRHLGRHNKRLVKKITAQKPDVICMVGDIINGTASDDHVAIELISQLKDVAPVYYAMGNHELEYCRAGHDFKAFKARLTQAGAVVLHRTIEDVTINGNEIRFGGMYEYSFETTRQSKKANRRARKYLNKYLAVNRYLIMCAHVPGTFATGNNGGKLGIDLILSGHLHGGQVIIPFVGGLYSQIESFFPTLDYGHYDLSGCDMIVIRGLGSDMKVLPRFCNPPEICVIDLGPAA